MKREMSLIRLLLLKLEDLSPGPNILRTIHYSEIFIEGYSPDQVRHHLGMLADSPFVNSDGFSRNGALLFRGISWEGHELIAAIRNDGIWETVIEEVKERGVDGAISILGDVAKAILKKKVNQIMGLNE